MIRKSIGILWVAIGAFITVDCVRELFSLFASEYRDILSGAIFSTWLGVLVGLGTVVSAVLLILQKRISKTLLKIIASIYIIYSLMYLFLGGVDDVGVKAGYFILFLAAFSILSLFLLKRLTSTELM